MGEGRQQAVDVLVVGAGFAGLATAYHLARTSRRRIRVVERRAVPGAHASGRNAALVLQSVASPSLRRVLAASCREYLERRDALAYRPCGSLLLGEEADLAAVREPAVVETRFVIPDEACRLVPLLAGHDFAAALLTPTDGVMDIGLLLGFYLQGAQERGVEISLRQTVRGLSRVGESWLVETSAGRVEAAVVVDAAGAWAGELAALADATPLPLVAWKRHLFVYDGPPLAETAPYVWSLAGNFYFRPESGGILFSACDEERSEHLVESVSTDIGARAAELVVRELPALAEATERTVWSCFRTKAPDGEPVVGWDPVAPGFFWVAGLGGHGMGASWEIGRLAAEALLDQGRHDEPAFCPGRVLGLDAQR